MTTPRFIIRLDDACPTMDQRKWGRIEELLRARDVLPIVAVVPANADLALKRSPPDPRFWDRVRAWRDAGWHVAMHGYAHEALTRNRGMIPLHVKSEFAGVPLEEQRRRLRAAHATFVQEGLRPSIWVAPFHTFDSNTLRALRDETEIDIISDGLSPLPFGEEGFFWLPQQLWSPSLPGPGVWTINLHPNHMREQAMTALSHFLDEHPMIGVDIAQLKAEFGGRERTWGDRAFAVRLLLKRRAQDHALGRAALRTASRLKRALKQRRRAD